jgi:predicted negative regulator of RcsB-dependent stress response
MGEHLPIVLIEVVLIFGGVLAFGWWQLREIEVDRRKAAAARDAREKSATPDERGNAAPSAATPAVAAAADAAEEGER